LVSRYQAEQNERLANTMRCAFESFTRLLAPGVGSGLRDVRTLSKPDWAAFLKLDGAIKKGIGLVNLKSSLLTWDEAYEAAKDKVAVLIRWQEWEEQAEWEAGIDVCGDEYQRKRGLDSPSFYNKVTKSVKNHLLNKIRDSARFVPLSQLGSGKESPLLEKGQFPFEPAVYDATLRNSSDELQNIYELRYDLLRRTLAILSQDDADLLRLVVGEGKTYAEISRATGKSEESLRARASRAMKKVKEKPDFDLLLIELTSMQCDYEHERMRSRVRRGGRHLKRKGVS
jgi:RNA polymerase sigma factor (sigma-70 family)